MVSWEHGINVTASGMQCRLWPCAPGKSVICSKRSAYPLTFPPRLSVRTPGPATGSDFIDFLSQSGDLGIAPVDVTEVSTAAVVTAARIHLRREFSVAERDILGPLALRSDQWANRFRPRASFWISAMTAISGKAQRAPVAGGDGRDGAMAPLNFRVVHSFFVLVRSTPEGGSRRSFGTTQSISDTDFSDFRWLLGRRLSSAFDARS